MRILKLTAALLAALALSATGLAFASSLFKQASVITLTAAKAGKPTGLKASLESSDTGALQPQGLKTLTITLPTGTRFDFKSKAIKQCTAPEVEIKATLGKACPGKSKIGSGTAVANGAPVLPVIPENAVAYASKHQIVFLLTPATAAGGQVLVLFGKVAANKVTTSVPVINAGGLNVVITALKLTIKTIGSGSNAFITAGKCTGGKFVVKSGILYQTGATLALSSSSKCSK
ncbi:MAG TPA: hypothetical protein VK272_00750 [Solirubrobacteraceae bacterium]|nr:hypothetical protein [Solirubrobacteraceae bacterium]